MIITTGSPILTSEFASLSHTTEDEAFKHASGVEGLRRPVLE